MGVILSGYQLNLSKKKNLKQITNCFQRKSHKNGLSYLEKINEMAFFYVAI